MKRSTFYAASQCRDHRARQRRPGHARDSRRKRIRSRLLGSSAGSRGMQPQINQETPRRLARPQDHQLARGSGTPRRPDCAELVGGTTVAREIIEAAPPPAIRGYGQQGVDGPVRRRAVGSRHRGPHQHRHGRERTEASPSMPSCARESRATASPRCTAFSTAPATIF